MPALRRRSRGRGMRTAFPFDPVLGCVFVKPTTASCAKAYTVRWPLRRYRETDKVRDIQPHLIQLRPCRLTEAFFVERGCRPTLRKEAF